MAQAVLSTVGSVVGTYLGGPIGGFIGRTAGAYLGGYIDRNYLFAQNYERKGPRLDSAPVVTSSPGAPILRLWGRGRVAGELIWLTKYREEVVTESQRQQVKGGGGNKVTTTTYNYYASFAIGLCEGVASGYGRIWADGKLLDQTKYTIRFYKGTADQTADSKISAVEGAANTPAFRNTCYIVFDDMLLEAFGNRIPQIHVEVFKPIVGDQDQTSALIEGVVMLPGTGENVLGTEIYFKDDGYGGTTAQNVYNGSNQADALVSLDQLESVLTNAASVIVPIEWYADGYDTASCTITPRLAEAEAPSIVGNDVTDFTIVLEENEAFSVTNVSGGTQTVTVYKVTEETSTDGTITSSETTAQTFASMADAATEVFQSQTGGVYRIAAAGIFDVKQYVGNNVFPNEWAVGDYTRFTAAALSSGALADGASGTPSDATVLEYIAELKARGLNVILRPVIAVDASPYTTSKTLTTDDGNASAATDATAFFGTGSDDRYRAFIKHYANLSVEAGGVDAFLIGGNMKGLTHAQDNTDAFPFVDGLVSLLSEVRAIVGGSCELSYASDWTEYGAKWDGSDLWFPLDDLWSDSDCDFVGIDYYPPLSDWRDGIDHQDYSGFDGTVVDTPTPMDTLFTLLGLSGDDDSSNWESIYHPTSNYLFTRSNYTSSRFVELGRNDFFAWATDAAQINAIRIAYALSEYPSGESGFVSTAAAGQDIIVEFSDVPGRYFKFNIDTVNTLNQINTGKQFVMTDLNTEYISETNFLIPPVIGCQSDTLKSLAYLKCNIEGGEGYDWEYLNENSRNNQFRTEIVDPDGLSKEWCFRYKDIRNWWANAHYPRTAGVEGSATGWTAKGKPIWFTAFGCPSVNKGSNQADASDDHRWNERKLPWFSDGTKDDNIQRLYIQAVIDYWTDNAPASDQYVGDMIAPADMHAACWDARPSPTFPNRSDIWTDTDIHPIGHWLTGKIGNTPLGLLVEEIAGQVGLSVDVTGLEAAGGDVIGFYVDQLMSPRDQIAVLAAAYNFDGFESEGVLKFAHRSIVTTISITEDELTLTGTRPEFDKTRTQEIEIPAEMKILFADEAEDYLQGEVSERTQAGQSQSVAQVTLPLVLDAAYARAQVGTMIHEAWSGREITNIGLPLSFLKLDPTDIFSLTVQGITAKYKVERIMKADKLSISLAEVDPTVYDLRYAATAGRKQSGDTFKPTGRSVFGFMDLPLIRGDEVPFSPRMFAYQTPWPGQVDVYRKIETNSIYNSTITDQSVVGELVDELPSGITDIWDNVNTVSVRIYSGTLQSRTEMEVLSGLNILAVQNQSGDWELLQYVNATLVSPGVYDLTKLLRGQMGTEGAMRDNVPIGSRIVLLDYKAQPQIEMSIEQRLLDYTYRYGPALQSLSSDAYRETNFTAKGIGLRPYSVVDVAASDDGTDVTFTFKRRTRIGGDVWDGGDVPLSEGSEAYEMDIYDGSTIVRTLTSPIEEFTYTDAQITSDFGSHQSSYKVRIYQISEVYGRGQYREVTVNV